MFDAHRISSRTSALFCTLMRSSFDGEVVSARNAFVRSLASDGFGPHDIMLVPVTKQIAVRARQPSPFDLARTCRDLDMGRLTDRERAFVSQMARRGRMSPSPKQAQWLGDIFAKLQREAAA